MNQGKPCWVERKALEENNLNVFSRPSRQSLVALVADSAFSLGSYYSNIPKRVHQVQPMFVQAAEGSQKGRDELGLGWGRRVKKEVIFTLGFRV